MIWGDMQWLQQKYLLQKYIGGGVRGTGGDYHKVHRVDSCRGQILRFIIP